MPNLPHPYRPVALSAGDLALELRDVGASDLSVSEAEARCDELNAEAEGWRDAVCESCRAAICVPVESSGRTLCESCRGNGPDDVAMLAEYAAELARWPDDFLVTGVAIVDEGRNAHWFRTPGERAAWLSAATAEILKRFGDPDLKPAA